MGMYYILAAYQENRMFFLLTVPMRAVTAGVFWGFGGVWRIVGLWEGAGALVTALGMGWEAWMGKARRAERRKRKGKRVDG